MVYISVADRRRKEDDNILNDWKSDISTSAMPNKKGPRTTEYDKQKGRFKCSLYYILFTHNLGYQFSAKWNVRQRVSSSNQVKVLLVFPFIYFLFFFHFPFSCLVPELR